MAHERIDIVNDFHCHYFETHDILIHWSVFIQNTQKGKNHTISILPRAKYNWSFFFAFLLAVCCIFRMHIELIKCDEGLKCSETALG